MTELKIEFENLAFIEKAQQTRFLRSQQDLLVKMERCFSKSSVMLINIDLLKAYCPDLLKTLKKSGKKPLRYIF